MTPQLEVDNIRAGYDSINVLWDVSIAVAAGRTTSIVGPNGAGKTTLLKAITGLLTLGSGDIRMCGESIARLHTWDLVGQGVVMIPEGRMIFPDMTVYENLVMGAFPKHARKHKHTMLDYCMSLFPRLAERQTQLAGTLSGGEAQMLALGRGLMEKPKLLLIDEPSLGLAPVIVDEIFSTLKTLGDDGITTLLVEQNTRHALAISDYTYVMRSGKVVLSDESHRIDMAELKKVYFSGDTEAS